MAIDYPYMKLVGDNGTVWELPAEFRTFSHGEVERSREGDTADGSYVEDLLTTKDKFTVSYSILDGTDLDKAVAIRATNAPATFYYKKTYTSATIEKTVRVRPITDRSRKLAMDTGLWENVTIEMREV